MPVVSVIVPRKGAVSNSNIVASDSPAADSDAGGFEITTSGTAEAAKAFVKFWDDVKGEYA